MTDPGVADVAAARLEVLVEQAPIAIVCIDSDGAVLSWNPAAERMFGWTAAEVVGRPYPLLADPDQVSSEIRTVEAGGTYADDGVRLRRDGSELAVRVVAAPLRHADGSTHGIVSLLTDVSEQRRAEEELRRLNAELEQRVAERTVELAAANAELRSFSYSISHDLRTPLRAIDGFGQALLEDYGQQLDEAGRDHLERIRRASQRMASLIDDVLQLSRVTRTELQRTQVDVSELAREVAAELERAEPARAVEVHVEDGLLADADPQLLRVVLQNLLENARKFTRDVDAPRVEVTAAGVEGARGISVADNGAGFPEQYRDRLFKPFQRLHAASQFPGNGIGLATVFNVVQRHGGSVRAESPAGGGARFTVTFETEGTP